MKKVTKFFMAALLAGMCSFGYAQTQPDYMKPPKSNEKVIGIVSSEFMIRNNTQCGDGTLVDWYNTLLENARKEYPNYPVDIRNMETGRYEGVYSGKELWLAPAVGKVVVEWSVIINSAINKALRNVREGSRMAIDQVTVTNNMDRGEFKDQLIDVLLDKGYKIVAKEYLDKLYEEQQAQQSGIYNERTTVQENNFSAVGYYINVKVTETSLRVQVVNVSTGEYEGNATVNF